MKYKAEDRVKTKSLDWYNENKDKFGKVWTSGGQIPFEKHMSKWCGKVMTISDVRADHYTMIEDLVGYWTDEMIEGLVEEEEIEFTKEDKYWCDIMSESDPTTYVLPQGYQFVDENGNVINATKIVLEKKKKEYPKTYEECCKVMGVNHTNDLDICEHCDYKTEITYYEDSLLEKIEALYRLCICRDAYWKIAGEEIGLGKLWEPDWTKADERKYCIVNTEGNITKWVQKTTNKILAFPTEEMRDTFKENFDTDLEICKEFL